MQSKQHRFPDRFDLAALLLGAALPAAFAPLALYPLAVLIPAALFWLWREQTPRRAFRTGFIFGLGMFGTGVWWVYVAIHDFGNSSALLAGALTAVFVAFLAVLIGWQGWVSAWCRQRLPDSRWLPLLVYAWVFPGCWVLFEWIRGWIFTGFPWLNLGYSQIDSPLAGYAPLIGVYGLTLLVVLSAGLTLALLTTRHVSRYLAAVLLPILWFGGEVLLREDWTNAVSDPMRVAIVQGNQDQLTKWDEDKIYSQLQAYLNLSEPHWEAHDLIIWPENALTIFYSDLRLEHRLKMQAKIREHDTDLLIGLPYGDYTTYYSSLLLLHAGEAGIEESVYHKRHLVPFGEYVPFQEILRGLIGFFDLPMSGFSAGARQQAHLVSAGEPLAPSICYEDAFGEDLLDFLPKATLLVNGSNNAWYGDSWAPHQHLQIARMRALETGRMLMRATTNGISAIVDHKGQIVAASPQFASHVISAEVQPREGATLYVSYGNWPVLIVLLLSAVVLMSVPQLVNEEFDLAKL